MYIIGWFFICLLLIVIGCIWILCIFKILIWGLFRIGVDIRELNILLFVIVNVLFCSFFNESLLLCVFLFNLWILFLILVKFNWLVLCIIGIINLFGVVIVILIL